MSEWYNRVIVKPINRKNPKVDINFFGLHPELATIVLKAMQQMFDPVYNMMVMLRGSAEFRHNFMELLVAIELINISQGTRKKPSEGMIHFMQKFISNKAPDESLANERFADLVTLLYFDKRSKLIRMLVKHHRYPKLYASDVMDIVSMVIRKEGLWKLKRQDSDLTKVEGGSKDIQMEPYFRDITEEDGNVWRQEAAATKADAFYREITRSNDWSHYADEIVDYAEQLYRSDRAKNILRVVHYYVKEPVMRVNLVQMAKDLGISYKTVFSIVKIIRTDRGFQKIIKSIL